MVFLSLKKVRHGPGRSFLKRPDRGGELLRSPQADVVEPLCVEPALPVAARILKDIRGPSVGLFCGGTETLPEPPDHSVAAGVRPGEPLARSHEWAIPIPSYQLLSAVNDP